MAIPPLVEDYLSRHGARYDLVAHPKSHYSSETAELAHVPGDRLVKSVVLEDEDGVLLAVLPSTRNVHLGHLSAETHRRLRWPTRATCRASFPIAPSAPSRRSAPPTACASCSTTAWKRRRTSGSRPATTSISCT